MASSVSDMVGKSMWLPMVMANEGIFSSWGSNISYIFVCLEPAIEGSELVRADVCLQDDILTSVA